MNWTDIHDKAFQKIKNAVTEAAVLQYFDPAELTTVQCDASETGVGAALMQAGKPVAYASRSLTTTKQNYAQMEKELLVTVFGMEGFTTTPTKPVSVETDLKPLETIFKKHLQKIQKRLQRMLLRLQRYDITVTYQRGTQTFFS